MFLILVTAIFAVILPFIVSPVKGATYTWTVDDDGPADFQTIQEAINNSTNSDTIIVNSGNYSGNIEINKTLTIRGASTKRPIIFGDQTVSVVKITANDVQFSGFEVTNAGFGDSYGDHETSGGIELFEVYNCIITDNLVHDNLRNGISLVNANHNIITNNTCSNNSNGIRLWAWAPKTTSYNIVSNNTCCYNRNNGILFWSYVYNSFNVNYNNVTDNLIIGFPGYVSTGLDIGKSRGNLFARNTITSTHYSLNLDSVYDSRFIHNNFLDAIVQVRVFDDQESGPTADIWDNGYPSGGNYWSNYNGTDNNDDEIGDIPYIINVDNEDRYPLMSLLTSNPAPLSPIPTPTAQPTPTPVPTYNPPPPPPTPTPTPTPTPNATFTPTPEPTPTPTPSPTPTPTSAPLPTSSPTLTPTPSPNSSTSTQQNLTFIEVSCQSSSSQSNFRVDITGNVTSGGIGLQNTPVLLLTSINGGESWDALTTVNTNSNGEFATTWTPSSSGNYLLRALWAGNTDYLSANATINCVVTPFEEASNFLVSSNSTLSGLSFDSASKELSFSVVGADGTSGYVSVSIPKSLIVDISGIRVYLDGDELPYTVESQQDSWYISFSYHHSSHQVEIRMDSKQNTQFQITPELLALLGIIITVLIVGLSGLFVAFRRSKK